MYSTLLENFLHFHQIWNCCRKLFQFGRVLSFSFGTGLIQAGQSVKITPEGGRGMWYFLTEQSCFPWSTIWIAWPKWKRDGFPTLHCHLTQYHEVLTVNPFPHNTTFWRLWETSFNEQFILFPQCFLPVWITCLPFSSNLKLSSAKPFNLEESKICRLVKS